MKDLSGLPPHIAKQLNAIIDRIVETVPTHSIILFGSYARGDARPDSDLDLYVLTSDDKKRDVERIRDIYIATFNESITPMDVLSSTRERFSARALSSPTLEHTIAREGRAIYGA